MMSEILFLAHRVPYPPNRGDKIRSWNLIRALAKIAPVHVVALCDDLADLEHRAIIEEVAASVTLIPLRTTRMEAMATALFTGAPASVRACASAELRTAVENLLASRPISTIYAFSGQMAQFVPEVGEQRFVMDFVDMDSAKFKAFSKSADGISKFANAQEARRLFAFERKVASRADVSLFVSEAEAAYFRRKAGLGSERVLALENGIDLSFWNGRLKRQPVKAGKGPLIVFTGQMNYTPNVEAVSIFAREVLPLVRFQVPDAVFAIVGRSPTAEVEALAKLPGVMVTGSVPDTRDWLAAAEVVVAPLRLARGIQNKVLEAMAMSKAVVASPAAAEGIDARYNRDLLVASGVAAEADAVIRLLGDKELAKKIGKAARARMTARYGWKARLAGLPSIVGFEAELAAKAA
jgi:polysaccharide biosynthesis protein PslH